MSRALIVEDEPVANRLLARLVQLRGVTTESAYTGREALDAVERNRPDIIFLDLMLPDTTGFEICETWKARRGTHAIPVYMVTARLAAENRIQSYRHGASGYIPKPYTPDQIFQALTEAAEWPERLARFPNQGELLVDIHGEPCVYSRLGRFWTLLMERTSWDAERIHEFIHDLGDWIEEILNWGRHRLTDCLARVEYDLGPDHLTLTIFDEVGWSYECSTDRLTTPGWFHQVIRQNQGRELILTRHLN